MRKDSKDAGPPRYSRTILRDLGIVLHVPGVMAIASLPICFAFGETFAIAGFLWTAAAAFVPGQALFWAFRRTGPMQVRHAMVTSALSWLGVSVVGLIPFVVIAAALAGRGEATDTVLAFTDPLNALFESVSGFTSTGLTVTLRPSELPRALQWWRSFMEWVGGVGVIVMVLVVFHRVAEAGRLMYSEARNEHILPELVGTVRVIWWVYALWTVVGILLLRAADMPWWDAVNHGMTGISTGGFSIADGNLGAYSRPVQAVAIILMVAGSISFAAHYRIITQRQAKLLWHEREYRALFVLLLVGVALVAAESWLFAGTASLPDSAFQWVSALCTAGFQTVDLATWSPTALLLLTLGMVLGGASGATTGGLKLRRVLVLADAARIRIARLARQPWRLMEHKPIAADSDRGGHGPIVEAATMLAVLWIGCIVVGATLLLHALDRPVPFTHALVEAASALGNVGLSTGLTHPDLHWLGKATLMLLMWVGRLEIVPVLVVISAVLSVARGGKS